MEGSGDPAGVRNNGRRNRWSGYCNRRILGAIGTTQQVLYFVALPFYTSCCVAHDSIYERIKYVHNTLTYNNTMTLYCIPRIVRTSIKQVVRL